MDMILILEDDYIADRKKYLSEGYEALHQKLAIYEACLDDIVENGIASGEVSKALKEFAKQVVHMKTSRGRKCKIYKIFKQSYWCKI